MQLMSLRSTCLTLVICALHACAGNGEGLDQNGRPATPTSPGTGLQPNLNSIQDNVFTPVCTRCHAGANAPRGLRLEAGISYAMLVGVPSNQVPAVQRVRPGDPNASYLIQKLNGTAAVGQRMPLGGPFLPQSTIDVIAQWIAMGAPRPAAFDGSPKSTPTGLHMTASWPIDGTAVEAPITHIVVGFDRELDANLANASTVMLRNLDREYDIALFLRIPIVNPSTLLIAPVEPLTAGRYRLTLRGSGGGALAGLDAKPLNLVDEAGRDQSITFVVTTAQ